MSQPEYPAAPADGGTGGEPSPDPPAHLSGAASPPRYGRYAVLLALVILTLITVNTIVTKPNGATGIEPGQALPPFAVPLASSPLSGDADIATRPNQGGAGRVPACSLHAAQILNVCQLYERGPLVLVLFVDAGSCPAILDDMQALAPSFPGVQFAAVAIKSARSALRTLVRSRHLTLPIGVDRDGVLVALYKDASCPQVTFAYPGGVVQSRALLSRPSYTALRARVSELAAASRARGWRPPGA
jgi:hypothetical protein